MLSKKDAKRWAYDIASTLIATDIENSDSVTDEDDPDYEMRQAALWEVVKELRTRAGDVPHDLYYNPK